MNQHHEFLKFLITPWQINEIPYKYLHLGLGKYLSVVINFVPDCFLKTSLLTFFWDLLHFNDLSFCSLRQYSYRSRKVFHCARLILSARQN